MLEKRKRAKTKANKNVKMVCYTKGTSDLFSPQEFNYVRDYKAFARKFQQKKADVIIIDVSKRDNVAYIFPVATEKLVFTKAGHPMRPFNFVLRGQIYPSKENESKKIFIKKKTKETLNQKQVSNRGLFD